MKPNKKLRNSYWEEMLESERVSRYYNYLCEYFLFQTKLYKWLFLITSASFTTSILIQIFKVIPFEYHTFSQVLILFVSIILTGISLIFFIKNPQQQIIMTTVISDQIDPIVDQYKHNWNMMNEADFEINEESIRNFIKDSREKITLITSRGKGLARNKKLEMKAHKEVVALFSAQQA